MLRTAPAELCGQACGVTLKLVAAFDGSASSCWSVSAALAVSSRKTLVRPASTTASPATEHAWLEDSAGPTACLRILCDPEAIRIGRVCTRADARGAGAATRLLGQALERHPGRRVVLDAQAYLVGFYAGFGFAPSGPEFLEDGIAHVPMCRPVTTSRG